MPSESTAASAKDIRKFALFQFALTAVFLGVVFWMFNGTDADYPPIWVAIALMVAIAIGAFLSERVWLRGPPLDPEESSETNQALALEHFTSQTFRRLVYTEAPLILAVLFCFFGDFGGWPVLIAAGPGLAVQAWETWPHLRTTSMAAAIFDSKGAESRLVENFVRP